MGFNLATAFITARGDTSNVARDFQAGQPQVESAARSLQQTVNRILAGIGVGLSIGAIINEMRQGIALAERQIDAEARMGAVIKGTGASAGYTADQIKRMAAEMQKVTTVGDEEFMEMAAIMLTFKSITGDTFRDATETVLNMAAVMGTQARSAAMQLGRALEDPVRGVSALRRTGVSFSEEQKVHIKQLVESNKLNEAQAFVLSVVKGQLGDVAKEMAKTPSGKLKQARNILGDMKELLGVEVIPLQTKLVDLQGRWIQGLTVVSRVVRHLFDQHAGLTTMLTGTASLLALVAAGWTSVAIAANLAGISMKTALIGTGIGIAAVALGAAIGFLWDKLEVISRIKVWAGGEKIRIGLRMARNYLYDFYMFWKKTWNAIAGSLWNTLMSMGKYIQSSIGMIFGTSWGKYMWKMAGGMLEVLDSMLGSWDGFVTGLQYIGAEIVSLFKLTWEKVRHGSVESLGEMLTFMMRTLEDTYKQLSGVLPEAVMMTMKPMFSNLHDALNVALKASGIGDEEKRHEEAVAKIKTDVLSLRGWYADQMGDLPKLSGLFGGIMDDFVRRWKEAQLQIRTEDLSNWLAGLAKSSFGMAAKVIGILNPEEEEKKKKGQMQTVGGRMGFQDYGRQVQDMFLKNDDPAKKTAENTKKTVTAVEKMSEGLGKQLGELIDKGLGAVGYAAGSD